MLGLDFLHSEVLFFLDQHSSRTSSSTTPSVAACFPLALEKVACSYHHPLRAMVASFDGISWLSRSSRDQSLMQQFFLLFIGDGACHTTLPTAQVVSQEQKHLMIFSFLQFGCQDHVF